MLPGKAVGFLVGAVPVAVQAVHAIIPFGGFVQDTCDPWAYGPASRWRTLPQFSRLPLCRKINIDAFPIVQQQLHHGAWSAGPLGDTGPLGDKGIHVVFVGRDHVSIQPANPAVEVKTDHGGRVCQPPTHDQVRPCPADRELPCPRRSRRACHGVAYCPESGAGSAQYADAIGHVP